MAYYNWTLVFHIVSMVSWMAMLFYLPRLFVYHVENQDNEAFVKVVEVQEYKLYKYIGLPSMMLTIITGMVLIFLNPTIFQTGAWLHAKLTLVLVLVAYTFSLGYYRRSLAYKECKRSGAFFRFYNEVPTIVLIYIVTFVLFKSIPMGFVLVCFLLFVLMSYRILFAKKKS